MERYKYPKTSLVSWSHKVTSDDVFHTAMSMFEGKEIVVTEKLDGESTSLYNDFYYHARSINSSEHPSHGKVKALLGKFFYMLPNGWRVCGENCVALHTMRYEELPAPFFCYSIWDDKNEALSWDETEEWCKKFGIQTVPVLYRGEFNIDKVKKCYTGESVFGGEQEGYVVRVADSFHYDNFQNNLAKYVRPDFGELLNERGEGRHWRQCKYEENRIK